MFDQLDKEAIHKIIDIELQGLYKRVAGLGYSLELTDAAKDFVATKGYDIQFGARPLKRAIQKYLEDEMAEMIIRASVGEGDTIVVDFDKDKQEIVTNVKRKASLLPKLDFQKCDRSAAVVFCHNGIFYVICHKSRLFS